MKRFRVTAAVWPKGERKRYVTVTIKAKSYEEAEKKALKQGKVLILDVEELDPVQQ